MGNEDSRSGSTVWDIEADADLSRYECLECGWSKRAATSPGSCPECDNELRNCSMPLE